MQIPLHLTLKISDVPVAVVLDQHSVCLEISFNSLFGQAKPHAGLSESPERECNAVVGSLPLPLLQRLQQEVAGLFVEGLLPFMDALFNAESAQLVKRAYSDRPITLGVFTPLDQFVENRARRPKSLQTPVADAPVVVQPQVVQQLEDDGMSDDVFAELWGGARAHGINTHTAECAAMAAAFAARSASHVRQSDSHQALEFAHRSIRGAHGALADVLPERSDPSMGAQEYDHDVLFSADAFVACVRRDYELLLRMKLGAFPALGGCVDCRESGPLGRLRSH